MKRCFFIVFVILTLFPYAAQTKEWYVIDNFKIMVRRQPGEMYKIVEQLPSDEKVRIMKTEEDWAKISFRNGKTGWVLKRFLTEEVPKPIQMEQLEKKIKDLEETIEALKKEKMSIKQKYAEMGETIAAQSVKVKDISLENQRLKEGPYRIILLLSGGGIFLIGCIVTLIIQGLGRGRRNKLSFEKGIRP